MIKINCDTWSSKFTGQGVEITLSNLVPFRTQKMFSKIIPFEDYVDFLNSEIMFFRGKKSGKNPVDKHIAVTHHKGSTLCFDFMDSENDTLYRVNPVAKGVWLNMLFDDVRVFNAIAESLIEVES